MESSSFFEMMEACKMSCVKYFLPDLLGSLYFFEILQTSLTVKNSKNA